MSISFDGNSVDGLVTLLLAGGGMPFSRLPPAAAAAGDVALAVAVAVAVAVAATGSVKRVPRCAWANRPATSASSTVEIDSENREKDR
jgi:hypothetical protein